MKAPAVGTSSKAMRRPNSSADRHTPDGPPICTACASRAPQSSSMRPMRDAERIFVDARALAVAATPSGSWCRWTCGVPMPAHQAPPCSAMCAAAQKVSTLLTDGRLAEVAVLDREGRADARRAALAFQRFDQRRFLAADVGAGADVDLDVEIEALAARGCACPAAPRRAGAAAPPAAARAGSGTRRAGRRSPAARRSRARRRSCPRTPGRHGACSSTRSLKVPGSPSSALQTTTCSRPAPRGTAPISVPVANPAPPRPRRLRALRSRPASPRRRAPAPRASAVARRRRPRRAARRRGGCCRRPANHSARPLRPPARRLRISSAMLRHALGVEPGDHGGR